MCEEADDSSDDKLFVEYIGADREMYTFILTPYATVFPENEANHYF